MYVVTEDLMIFRESVRCILSLRASRDRVVGNGESRERIQTNVTRAINSVCLSKTICTVIMEQFFLSSFFMITIIQLPYLFLDNQNGSVDNEMLFIKE